LARPPSRPDRGDAPVCREARNVFSIAFHDVVSEINLPRRFGGADKTAPSAARASTTRLRIAMTVDFWRYKNTQRKDWINLYVYSNFQGDGTTRAQLYIKTLIFAGKIHSDSNGSK
jgi:hypothetical protein